MPIDKIIVSGNQNELKPTFMLAEALYEMFTELENSISSNVDTDRISLPRGNHPRVFLYFLEDPTKSRANKNRYGLLSFRLMKYQYKNIESLSKTALTSLGTRIKELLGEPMKGDEKEEFQWHKGQSSVAYTDWENGLQLQILCNSKSDGISVVERLCEVVDAPYHPEWVFFSQNNEPAEAYPSTPPAKTILGKQVTQFARRQQYIVRLQRAYAVIPGMINQIVLYDVRGTNPTALVK